MSKIVDLGQIMGLIEQGWVFSNARYPDFEAQSDKFKFVYDHINYHQDIARGELARQLERRDHGEAGDPGVIVVAVMKMVVNTLRLARSLGISAEEIREYVIKQYS